MIDPTLPLGTPLSIDTLIVNYEPREDVMNFRLVCKSRAFISGTHFFQANRQTPSFNAAKMSTPADKVLRKFENKINLGEFLRYSSSH